MKNSIFYLTALIIFSACKKESENQISCSENEEYADYQESMSEIEAFSWFPDSSDIQYSGSSIIVTPPDEWIYLGDAGHLGVIGTTGPITVTCSCSGTCDALSDGTKGWCESVNCIDECVEGIGSGSISFISGGFVNLNAEPDFIYGTADFPSSFDEMYIFGDVQELMIEFIEKIYGIGTFPDSYPEAAIFDDRVIAPDSHSFAPVNIAGRAMFIIVPDSEVPEGVNSYPITRCSCLGGEQSGSCSITIPQEGNPECSQGSCAYKCSKTLSFISEIDSIEVIAYTAISYTH